APTPTPTLPTLSISNLRLNEGNTGITTFAFPVTLSRPVTNTVTVQFSASTHAVNEVLPTPATGGANCGAGIDFITVTNLVLTFNPGVTTQQANVQVCGDTAFEPDNTFVVALSSPVNATIQTGSAIGTIANDDLRSLSIADVSVVEGNAGTVVASFPVTLSGASGST